MRAHALVRVQSLVGRNWNELEGIQFRRREILVQVRELLRDGNGRGASWTRGATANAAAAAATGSEGREASPERWTTTG